MHRPVFAHPSATGVAAAWSPLVLDPSAWWDADDADSVGGDGATWTDLVGGKILSTRIGSSSPTYDLVNGRGSLLFDGVSAALESPSSGTWQTGELVGAGAYTAVTVGTMLEDPVRPGTDGVDGANASPFWEGTSWMGQRMEPGPNLLAHQYDGGGNKYARTPFEVDAPVIATMMLTGTALRQYNGAEAGPDKAATTPYVQSLDQPLTLARSVGSVGYTHCRLMELVFFKRALTADDLALLVEHLAEKWGAA